MADINPDELLRWMRIFRDGNGYFPNATELSRYWHKEDRESVAEALADLKDAGRARCDETEGGRLEWSPIP